MPECIFSRASANIFCCSAIASASERPEALVHLLWLRGDSWEKINPRFKVSCGYRYCAFELMWMKRRVQGVGGLNASGLGALRLLSDTD